ncbi:hypothetical protein ABEF95_014807 [Exophiala dermatitidis]
MHRSLAKHGLIHNLHALALRRTLTRVTPGSWKPGLNGGRAPQSSDRHDELLADGFTSQPTEQSGSQTLHEPQGNNTSNTQVQRTDVQKEETEKAGQSCEDTGRGYLRSVLTPKRYPPLLREIQRHGGNYKISSKKGRTQKSLDRSIASTETLEDELKWVARNYPHPHAIRNILKILIEDRKVKPSAAHYEALILANCFPELGSVENVKSILEEMEREGVLIEPAIYYAVLTVLAVHPDTYLRTTIIRKLREQWVSIPEQYAHFNVVAMIREGQLDLATVEMENLQQKQIPIPPWIWTIYIHAICDRHDFEGLLQVLYQLFDTGFIFPRPTLLHLLIQASQHGSLDVTKWVWYGYVETMHIMPNEELCIDVLRLAVTYEDRKLAESVIVVLESVAGDVLTTPPSLVDKSPPTKHELWSLTFNSPDLSGMEDLSVDTGAQDGNETSNTAGTGTNNAVDNAGEKSKSDSASLSSSRSPSTSKSSAPQPRSESKRLAMAFSTPLPLPPPHKPPPPRPLPEEAIQLLGKLGIKYFPTRRGRKRRGNLYPLFRKESGLRGARFDPQLALVQGWDWRKK